MSGAPDYTDVATVKALSEFDPELAKLLKTIPTNVPLPSLETQRADGLQRSIERAEASRNPGVREYTIEIPMRDGYKSELRIHEPTKDVPGGSPVYVLFYGGGFINGSNQQLCPFGNILAPLLGAVVVLPNYRLAPEHPFPAASYDAWDTLSWVVENASTIKANLSAGFIIGGISAGAQLSIVCAQKSVNEGMTPPLTGMWANIPAMLDEHTVPPEDKHLYLSMQQNANSPVGLAAQHIEFIGQAYKQDSKSPLWSPYNAPNPHKGMPPTFFQVAGHDPLRDDGLIYERTLRKNGVKTWLEVYPGVPHAHFAIFPQLESSKKASIDSILGLARLIGREVDPRVVMKFFVPPGDA